MARVSQGVSMWHFIGYVSATLYIVWADQEHGIQDIPNQIMEMKQVNQHLYSRIHDLSTSMEEIMNKNNECKSQVADIAIENIKLRQDNQQLQNRVNTISSDLRKMSEAVYSTYVSFTVATTGHQDIVEGEVVPYNVIIIDYGGFFNMNSSTFTCPLTGYYLFSISVLPMQGERMDVQLYINGEPQIRSISRDDSLHSTGSCQLVSLCNEAQSVWVQAYSNSTTSSSGMTNTFSGTILRIA